MSETITLPRATVKKALEALENSSPDQYPEDAGVFYDAKDALRAALEQPEQEQPVRAESVTTPPCKGMNCGAIDGRSHSLECHAEHSAAIAGGRFVPLPRREWRSLSEEEILVLYNTTPSSHAEMLEFARDIEAKLKEKNQ
jgi:hypothetical protein